jgi:hypothetical protein
MRFWESVQVLSSERANDEIRSKRTSRDMNEDGRICIQLELATNVAEKKRPESGLRKKANRKMKDEECLTLLFVRLHSRESAGSA